MSYIRKVIGHNERLVLLTGLHWIYALEAVLWFGIISGVGFILDRFLKNYWGFEIIGYDVDLIYWQISAKYTQMPIFFGLMGFAVFWVLLLKYLTTEIGLTDRRIIHKRGLIMIDVQQVELEDIRGEFVHHGWLGWLLGYGRIHFDCRFIDDIFLPATRDPYRLVKAVHTARMKSEKIPHYDVGDLEKDVIRIDQQRIEAFKSHEKLKRLALITKKEFKNSSNPKG